MSTRINSVFFYDFTQPVGQCYCLRNFTALEMTYSKANITSSATSTQVLTEQYLLGRDRSAQIRTYIIEILADLKEIPQLLAENSPRYIAICYADNSWKFFEYSPSFWQVFDCISSPSNFTSNNGAFPTKKSVKKKCSPLKAIGAFVIIVAIVIAMWTFGIFPFISPIERIKDSVVLVEVYDNDENLMGTGSGFCAYQNNWIVTNFHVIEGARWIKIVTDEGNVIDVNQIPIFCKKDDLAILEIDGELKPLTLGNGNNVAVKDHVTAIGSPMGERNTVSEGIVSNVDEDNVIRISVPISHGSSGGVLLDNRYHVVGITSAGYDNAQNLNFAINVNLLDKMYGKYQEQSYDIIDLSNYHTYASHITSYNTNTPLEMMIKSDKGYYYYSSADYLYYFYLASDPYVIFDSQMTKKSYITSSFCDRYKEFNDVEKQLAADMYTYLLQYESKTEDDPRRSTLHGNIPEWTIEEFIMELDIMCTYELAIMTVDLEYLLSNGYFLDYLQDSSLDFDSQILLYKLFNISDKRYDKDIIKYFEDYPGITQEQKYELLEYLCIVAA